jgi:hypothetical protein
MPPFVNQTVAALHVVPLSPETKTPSPSVPAKSSGPDTPNACTGNSEALGKPLLATVQLLPQSAERMTGTVHWTDATPSVGRFYYQVTALYGQSESAPSNEVAQVVTSLNASGDDFLPTSYTLFQNYPNPFNPSTTIRFDLPRRSQLTLIVFNTLGQHVATLIQGDQEAGYHEVKFNGTGLGSGVCFYRLQAGTFVQTKKLLLLH